MHRLFATAVFAFAGLAAAQWRQASWWLHGSHGLWCGNVVSDPYMLLVNVVGPLAAIANVALVGRALRTRRWPPYTITATLTFLVTSGCLAYEGYLLTSRYGLPLGNIWWLPWI